MTHSPPRKRLICGDCPIWQTVWRCAWGLRIDRAKRGTEKRKAVSVPEVSAQHTARYTGILICIEQYALHSLKSCIYIIQEEDGLLDGAMHRSALSRKHVRQDEPDHPGDEVETQKYF